DLIRHVAEAIHTREHLFVIGRGPSYPLALEAALKVKEVSYIHAEGFAGGDLKHGVIALIEPGTPCLVLAPRDETYDDIMAGAMQVKARGAMLIGVSPEPHEAFDYHVPVADLGPATAILNAPPAQLLGYYLALLRGHDPDKPRNLAKSVTVKRWRYGNGTPVAPDRITFVKPNSVLTIAAAVLTADSGDSRASCP